MTFTLNENTEYETPIYRYMDFSKFLSLIHQKYLFLARASSYEDGLEGMPTQLDSFLNSGAVEILDDVVNNLWPSAERVLDPERQRKLQEIAAARRRVEEREVDTVLGPQKARDYPSHDSIFEAVSKWVDVSCWHTDVRGAESMAMWKIYGAGAAAVCVQSTLRDVMESMAIPSDLQVYAGMVSYFDYKNDLVGNDVPINLYFQKSTYYEFEKELRIVMFPSKAIEANTPREQFGTKVSVDPKRLIKSVMVSPAASDWFNELVQLVLNEAGFDVPVAKSSIPFRKA